MVPDMVFVVVDRLVFLMGLVFLFLLILVAFRTLKVMRSSCDRGCASASMPSNAYAGKVVWVTGASSGIGKEMAVQLARQGAKLILSARREDVLNEVVEELKPLLAASTPLTGDVRVLPLDLADLESLSGKAAQALAFYGGVVDVLVNNGGYTSRALGSETMGLEPEIKMMNVNFLSCVALAKAVMPSMKKRKRGHIINISSLAGKFGSPLRTLYCGAKHALIGWFDALRAEEEGFWQSGIVITNVCPGSVRTDVAKNAVNAEGGRRGDSDPNIDAGLEVSFAVDRILASAHCGLKEVWIAKWNPELRAAYVNQYAPELLKSKLIGQARDIVRGTMGQEFEMTRLNQ